MFRTTRFLFLLAALLTAALAACGDDSAAQPDKLSVQEYLDLCASSEPVLEGWDATYGEMADVMDAILEHYAVNHPEEPTEWSGLDLESVKPLKGYYSSFPEDRPVSTDDILCVLAG